MKYVIDNEMRHLMGRSRLTTKNQMLRTVWLDIRALLHNAKAVFSTAGGIIIQNLRVSSTTGLSHSRRSTL